MRHPEPIPFPPIRLGIIHVAHSPLNELMIHFQASEHSYKYADSYCSLVAPSCPVVSYRYQCTLYLRCQTTPIEALAPLRAYISFNCMLTQSMYTIQGPRPCGLQTPLDTIGCSLLPLSYLASYGQKPTRKFLCLRIYLVFFVCAVLWVQIVSRTLKYSRPVCPSANPPRKEVSLCTKSHRNSRAWLLIQKAQCNFILRKALFPVIQQSVISSHFIFLSYSRIGPFHSSGNHPF